MGEGLLPTQIQNCSELSETIYIGFASVWETVFSFNNPFLPLGINTLELGNLSLRPYPTERPAWQAWRPESL